MNLVLVGGDALTPAGLTNKIGTRGLALVARLQPIYALCGSEKFWPEPVPVLLEDQTQDPQEIWAEAPANIQVLNFYFDQTPIEYLTGVVSQEGILSPSEVLAILKKITIHPRLSMNN